MSSYIIGRAESCDLRVDDEYASPRHARVWQDADGKVWVQDLGSTNGTHIIRPGLPGSGRFRARLGATYELHPGDVLVIGRTQIPWTRQEAT